MAREAVTETTKYTYTAPPLNREPVVRGELKHAKQRVPHEARGPEASIEQATVIYAIEHDTSAGYRNLISDTTAMRHCHEAERARVQAKSRLGELLHARPSTDELSVDRSEQQQETAEDTEARRQARQQATRTGHRAARQPSS